jgi:hypothetical protein
MTGSGRLLLGPLEGLLKRPFGVNYRGILNRGNLYCLECSAFGILW